MIIKSLFTNQQVSNVNGTGCFPSISVNPYSLANCAAIHTLPVFDLTFESDTHATTARPIATSN